MNFKRLLSLAGVVLTSLLMIAQTVQSFVLVDSEAKKTKRRLPPKT